MVLNCKCNIRKQKYCYPLYRVTLSKITKCKLFLHIHLTYPEGSWAIMMHQIQGWTRCESCSEREDFHIHFWLLIHLSITGVFMFLFYTDSSLHSIWWMEKSCLDSLLKCCVLLKKKNHKGSERLELVKDNIISIKLFKYSFKNLRISLQSIYNLAGQCCPLNINNKITICQ